MKTAPLTGVLARIAYDIYGHLESLNCRDGEALRVLMEVVALVKRDSAKGSKKQTPTLK